MGDATVRGVAVTQYQVWLSGKRLLNLIPDDEVTEEERDIIESVTYKYDFWIGKQDNVLYQQNLAILGPAADDDETGALSELSTLITFYDFNNARISIQPPR
jgi:hypothetical protein